MDDRIHRYLDGEIGLDELPEALRAEALRWDARLRGARALEAPGMPAGLADRIVRAVREENISRARRVIDWLLRPRVVRLSP
ncbi:MAG: hypothetical protein ACRELV_06320, partial [Longimicrobiales bacterium]